MNEIPAISSFPARKLPLAGAFFPPAGLSDLPLVQALSLITSDLSSYQSLSLPFQRRNARFLFRSVRILSFLFDYLSDSLSGTALCLPSAGNTCFRELYVLLHRSKLILDYCSHSSKLWLLLNVSRISAHFHDILQEISTLLDVLPIRDLYLDDDLLEQLELLHRQSRRSIIYLDPRGEALRLKISAFLENFANGQPPDLSDLRETFVRLLGIVDARSCRIEIEFLEDRIYSQEDDLDPGIIYGFVALARYARFSLFASADETRERKRASHLRKSSSSVSQMVPKDFCCPISLDLMRDPVIVSTGQTYDRGSIAQWIEEGHRTCPNSGQALTHLRLVPNRALRNLISRWCEVNDIPYDAPPTGEGSAEGSAARPITRAAAAANRATARILVRRLIDGSASDFAKAESARELRVLAKAGKENRLCVGEEGAVPPLKHLLRSVDSEIQVNAVTALLNLSLLECNKERIVQEAGCLTAIVEVCRAGMTAEARENAAAVLFSLSAVHEYKVLIAEEDGALQALAGLLANGSLGGKKDAVAALYNLSTNGRTCGRMVDSGAAAALVVALGVELVAEEAAAAVALLARRPEGAEALGNTQKALSELLGLMRRGTPRAKENAVAALLEICRGGGAAAVERVARAPALGGLLQTILFTGTKRARRKAASLVKVCRRSMAPPVTVGSASAASSHTTTQFIDSSTLLPAM